MEVIKTAFITGCSGVNITFYIENKKSYNYLKKILSFCAIVYKYIYIYILCMELDSFNPYPANVENMMNS